MPYYLIRTYYVPCEVPYLHHSASRGLEENKNETENNNENTNKIGRCDMQSHTTATHLVSISHLHLISNHLQSHADRRISSQ